MIHATTPDEFVLSNAGAKRKRWSSVTVSGAAVVAITLAASLSLLATRGPTPQPVEGSAPKPIAVARYSGLLDPGLARTADPVTIGRSLPLGPNFEDAAPTVVATSIPADNIEPAAPTPITVPTGTELVAAALSAVSPSDQSAPLPLPRPPGLGVETTQLAQRPMGRPIERAARTPGAPAAVADGGSVIDKLFGIPQALKSVLSYATPEDSQMNGGRIKLATPPWSSDRATAVYDISAHTVTLPNGATLEAHSGLGDRLDDPRHVHEPNRGATPPATYDLELRAQLFHGVQAIRLNPVSGGVFGRTGLLAHTYMLGPKGDSNGCVSFRNYDAFLQAYLNGQVKRLTVVAGR